MANIKNLIFEYYALKEENKALRKKIAILEKEKEELLSEDTSLKY